MYNMSLYMEPVLQGVLCIYRDPVLQDPVQYRNCVTYTINMYTECAMYMQDPVLHPVPVLQSPSDPGPGSYITGP